VDGIAVHLKEFCSFPHRDVLCALCASRFHTGYLTLR
jgi:hypothetical protein